MDKIFAFIKKHLGTLLFFCAAGLVGGFFTGLFVLDSYPDSMREQVLSEGMTSTLLGLVTALQGAVYGALLGAIGIALGSGLGLYKGERSIAKKPLFLTLGVGIVCGASMILFDLLWFGRVSEVIMDSYASKPSLAFIIGSVIYGGVIEEVMLRLFWLTLVAFVLHKVFGKGREKPANAVLIAANLIAALLFAAGHLPATAVMLGITPLLVFRCFLLNGGIGILLGYLYYRHGLRYSMIAHALCHVVSKLIWIIFI